MLHPHVESVNPPLCHSDANLHFLSNPATSPGGVPASPSFEFPSVKRDTKKDGAQKPHKSGDSSLGIYTKSCNPPPSEGYRKTQKLKQTARQITGLKRLYACGHDLNPNSSTVKIYKGESNYSFGGLQRCGSVWMCPSCASKITEGRRSELQTSSDKWLEQGHDISLLTLTAPHTKNDSLEKTLSGITEAFRKFTNRKPFKRFCQEYGVVGRTRTLEVTIGYYEYGNGWHPHAHVLLWHESLLDKADMAAEWFNLLEQWQSAAESVGLDTPNEHGLTWDKDRASTYISKWGLPEEMTKGHLKKGKKEGHISPFGLLELASEGDEEAGRLFLEFTKSFKGKRQLVWSDGLRSILGLGKEQSDQELAEQEPAEQPFIHIPKDHYLFLRNNDLIAILLHYCDISFDEAKTFIKAVVPGASDPPF